MTTKTAMLAAAIGGLVALTGPAFSAGRREEARDGEVLWRREGREERSRCSVALVPGSGEERRRRQGMDHRAEGYVREAGERLAHRPVIRD